MGLQAYYETLVAQQALPFSGTFSPGRQPVFGVGETHRPRVFVVFDFPSPEERASGVACSGRGQALVRSVLEKNGLNPEKDVYFGYLFKSEPQQRYELRLHHIRTFVHILAGEISLLKPRVVVCVGRYSATAVIACHLDADRLADRSRWFDFARIESAENRAQEDRIRESRATLQLQYSHLLSARQVSAAGLACAEDGGSGSQQFHGAGIIAEREMAFLPLGAVKGVSQRVFLRQAGNHVCWALATTSPYTIIGAEKRERPGLLKEWLASLATVKQHAFREAPIQGAFMEARIRQEFEERKASVPPPNKHTDVMQRFAGNAFSERCNTLRHTLLGDGTLPLCFFLTKIEYDRSSNEIEMYGRTRAGDSVFVRVPQAHDERLCCIYVKYPKCWRIGGGGKRAYPFDYEKDYEAQTGNHAVLLADKAARLRKMLRSKLAAAGCDFYRSDSDLLLRSSNFSERTAALCNGAVCPDKDWTVQDEVTDFALDRCFKLPFGAYDTQRKPRIRVSVRYHPVIPWLVRCIGELIAADSGGGGVGGGDGGNDDATDSGGEHVKYYEVDSSPIQHFTLGNNIYVGGWVEVAAYEALVGAGDAGTVRLRAPYSDYWNPCTGLGLKRGTCDLELITFVRHLTGHQPGLDLQFRIRYNELCDMEREIVTDLELHEAAFSRYQDGPGHSRGQTALRSEKYQCWIRIQNRRIARIHEACQDILRQRGFETHGQTLDGSVSSLHQWSTNAPLQHLFFDLECMTDGKQFPNADTCPIISICAILLRIDDNTRVDMKSGRCKWDEIAWFCVGPIDRAKAEEFIAAQQAQDGSAATSGPGVLRNTYCFDSEAELLRAWFLFVSDRDVNLIWGHNSDDFDVPYIEKRARVLKIYNSLPLGCVYGTNKFFDTTQVTTMDTFSKAYGQRRQRMLKAAGISFMDTCAIFRKEEKLVSYSLNAIALEKFGDKKVELPHVAIRGAFYHDRERLLVYNEKDVELTARLALNKNTPASSLEYIKLAGVFSQQEMYSRGQQFKVLNLLMRSIVNDGSKYIVDSTGSDVARLLERSAPKARKYTDKDKYSGYMEVQETFYSDSDESDSDGQDSDEVAVNAEGDPIMQRKRKMRSQIRRAKVTVKRPQQAYEFQDDYNNSNGEFGQPGGGGGSGDGDDNGPTICSYSDISSFIEDNVQDQSAAARKPLVLKTESEVRNRKRGALDADYDKQAARKVTKKQRESAEKAVENVSKIFEFFDGGEATAEKLRKLNRQLLKKKSLTVQEAVISEVAAAKYKGATCIEPRRGFHVEEIHAIRPVPGGAQGAVQLEVTVQEDLGERAGRRQYRAIFIICCDFSSLYPTVCIANNTSHDKNLPLRKLIAKNLPVEFFQPSTEKWPDPGDNCRDGWVFFLHSDYRPLLLDRCRNPDHTDTLLRLLRLTWPNLRWRHLTRMYVRVLRERGVAEAEEFVEDAPPPRLGPDYEPETAHDGEEYRPQPQPPQDIQPDDDDDDCRSKGYGASFACFDGVLLQFWEDDQPENDTATHPSRGILPKNMEMCLTARALVKGQMKNAVPGSAEHTSLDGTQLSLKIYANSGYGVTGTCGKLGNYAISASITGYGRRYLECSKNIFCRGTGKTYGFPYKDLVTGEARVKQFTFGGGENYGGDTDSFFNSITGIDYGWVEEMGQKPFTAAIQQLADEVNALLPNPVKLLFEKIMSPLLNVNKKRYSYVGFKRDKIECKGLECERRDGCTLAREMQKTVLKMLLIDLDIDGAVAYVREEARKLVEGEVDISRLVTSKQYFKADYKTQTLPHLITLKKRAHRGDPPTELGERVPYVMTLGTSDVKSSSLNADDPTWVLENDIQLDYEYYLEKQVKQPLIRIFSRVPGFRNPEKRLFGGITKKRFMPSLQSHHAISRYVRRLYPCILCGKETPQLCCRVCFEKRHQQVEERLRETSQEAADEYRARLEVCKTCLRQDSDDVQCENTPCPEYVPRKKALAGKRKADTRWEQLQALKRAGALEW